MSREAANYGAYQTTMQGQSSNTILKGFHPVIFLSPIFPFSIRYKKKIMNKKPLNSFLISSNTYFSLQQNALVYHLFYIFLCRYKNIVISCAKPSKVNFKCFIAQKAWSLLLSKALFNSATLPSKITWRSQWHSLIKRLIIVTQL